MKWFFAIDQYSKHLDSYAEMARVAVITAQINATDLEPNMLWDGDPDHEIAQWMRVNGVTVWPMRTPFYDELKRLADEKNDQDILSFGAGTFLRMEIPRLFEQQKWTDEYAFYSDVDVMFLASPVHAVRGLKPKYFACAPESNPENPEDINAGIMLINIPAMQRINKKLYEFGFKHLDQLVDYRIGNAFDQALFRSYFRPVTRRLVGMGASIPINLSDGYIRVWGRFYHRLRFLDKHEWDTLPLSLNWKSYWDINPDAIIVHFHGPKPNEGRMETSPESLAERNNDGLQKLLNNMRNESFRHYGTMWDGFRKQVHT